jgi:hypothetical protein
MYDIYRIERENRNAGRHFFDKATLKAFDSRIHSQVYQGPGGVYFVTSERFHGTTKTGPRRYNVRRFWPNTGGITSAERNFTTRRAAHKAAAQLAKDKDNA